MTYRIYSCDLNHTSILACLSQPLVVLMPSLHSLRSVPSAQLLLLFIIFLSCLTQKVPYFPSIVLCQVLTLHRDVLIVIQIIHCSADEGNKLIHQNVKDQSISSLLRSARESSNPGVSQSMSKRQQKQQIENWNFSATGSTNIFSLVCTWVKDESGKCQRTCIKKTFLTLPHRTLSILVQLFVFPSRIDSLHLIPTHS